MSTTVDLNNNTSACIQTVYNIGNNTYQNICDNTSHVVPWGTVDWIGFSLIGAMIIVTILGITLLIKAIAEDY